MSGHSKWSTIKHKKAANDAVKGSVFTKMAKAITIAVKKGGGVGDPEMNFSLRLMVDKARAVNMPKENIDRAIAKGLGKDEGEELTELTIEAFAPEGIVCIIEVVTDSRNRVVSELRNLIEKHGGRMGEPGSAIYQFERCGIIRTEEMVREELLLQAIDMGMTDSIVEEGVTTIYTNPGEMHKMMELLDQNQIATTAVLGYRPKVSVRVEESNRVIQFLEAISEYEDVQEVYVNLG